MAVTTMGRIAITASARAPISVILERTFLMYDEVGLPGRIPVIVPPFFLRLRKSSRA
jgi:hypothetical protein